MKTLFILFITLLFLFSATAYADMNKKSCYLDNGPGFENKMDGSSSSDYHDDMIKKHHNGMDKEHLMKKMEKNRDVIENEYHSDGSRFFDDYL